MTYRNEIIHYLNANLEPDIFDDTALNGLQIEGREKIGKIAVAVDAGKAVIEEAIRRNADMLIVHHGIFWGKSQSITGGFKEKLSLCLNAGLNLAAWHLPLDAHLSWGNNIALARLIGLANPTPCFPYCGKEIGICGENLSGATLDTILTSLGTLPGASVKIHHLPFGPTEPKKIAIVSGGGANALYEAHGIGIDTLITGEPKQACYHYAAEEHLNVVFAGHYATETLGVCEVGKALAAEFGLSWEFIDMPTGI
ncbi:MAG: Nif3-like dinuclear metal center hexameric protein [bacterium]|nr:Nif3-like dinuclear metal center hexameric protein [bacterium]